LWTRLLDVQRIGVRDNFFTLGGHSLLAVRLVAEIEKEFGRNIPLVSLFQAGTIESLAALLSNNVGSQTWPTLVQIQAGNSLSALFCVSAPNVNALGYISLARHLDSNQSVFGLQSQYPVDAEAEHSQMVVDQVATEYLAAMRTRQPNGPYYLIGMCRGAHIAYEMAIRLQEEGEVVALLGILDTFVMENTYTYLWYLEQYVSRVGFWLRLPFRDKSKFIRTKWRKAFNHVGNSKSSLRRVYFPGPGFVPKEYQGEISVFRVRKQPRNRIRDPHLGWSKLALGGVDIHYVPGNHETLLREPNVRVLADELKGLLVSNAGAEQDSPTPGRTADRRDLVRETA
jgi:thioesterase domain-containing protein/acyl carrier protein